MCDNYYTQTLNDLCVGCGYTLNAVSKNGKGDMVIDIKPSRVNGNPFTIGFTISKGGIGCTVNYSSGQDADVISTIVDLERAALAKIIIEYVFCNYENF